MAKRQSSGRTLEELDAEEARKAKELKEGTREMKTGPKDLRGSYLPELELPEIDFEKELRSLPELELPEIDFEKELRSWELPENLEERPFPDGVGELTKPTIIVKSSLTDLVDFCGVVIQKGDRDVVYELFKSVGRDPEDSYKKDNTGRIKLKDNRVTYFDASQIGLKSLPETIGNLQALRDFEVWGNQLTSLPEEIGKLTVLQKLYVRGNQLNEPSKTLLDELEKKGVKVYR